MTKYRDESRTASTDGREGSYRAFANTRERSQKPTLFRGIYLCAYIHLEQVFVSRWVVLRQCAGPYQFAHLQIREIRCQISPQHAYDPSIKVGKGRPTLAHGDLRWPSKVGSCILLRSRTGAS